MRLTYGSIILLLPQNSIGWDLSIQNQKLMCRCNISNIKKKKITKRTNQKRKKMFSQKKEKRKNDINY